jgi:cell wall-associated NlpC family hydrolase
VESQLINLYKASYKRGGRGNGFFDCQGLFLEVMRCLGKNVEEVCVEEDATKIVDKAIKDQLKNGRWLRLSEPEKGCVVTLALDNNDPSLVSHLGVYLGNYQFIHILEKRGVILSRIDDRFFKPKIRGFYRWIG